MDAGSYTWLKRCVHVGEAGVPTSRAFSKVQSPNVVMYSLPDSVHMEGSGGEREASDVTNQPNWTLCIKMIHIHDRRLLVDLYHPCAKMSHYRFKEWPRRNCHPMAISSNVVLCKKSVFARSTIVLQ